MAIFGGFTTACRSLRESRRGRWPIASDRKLLVEQMAARDGDRQCQGTAAQSPTRFDIATSRPDPLDPDDAGLLPQAPLSDLQPREVDRIVCDSTPRPVDTRPRQRWPPCQSSPKSDGPPSQAYRLCRTLPFSLGARGIIAFGTSTLRVSMALTPMWPPGPEQIPPPNCPQVDPLWITCFGRVALGFLGRRA